MPNVISSHLSRNMTFPRKKIYLRVNENSQNGHNHIFSPATWPWKGWLLMCLHHNITRRKSGILSARLSFFPHNPPELLRSMWWSTRRRSGSARCNCTMLSSKSLPSCHFSRVAIRTRNSIGRLFMSRQEFLKTPLLGSGVPPLHIDRRQNDVGGDAHCM
jgi:hypothetical protein